MPTWRPTTVAPRNIRRVHRRVSSSIHQVAAAGATVRCRQSHRREADALMTVAMSYSTYSLDGCQLADDSTSLPDNN